METLTELLDKLKEETSISKWYFCVEELLEALVIEVEKKGGKK